jgi:ABC-type transport system involved in multi-copper enzyme maturation permease subunit
MPTFVQAGPTGVARLFSWSTLKHSWVELLAGFVLAAGVTAAWWYHGRMVLAERVAVWALLLAVVALFLRRGWLRLFGPVLFYDLVRVSRRSRYIPLRCVYAGLLLLALYWQYSDFFLSRPPGPLRANRMAEFAAEFFNLFMVIQFLLVLLLTPVYAASSIAEEKDRQTLEYLLASDLSNREIVLSKLVSRLATLGLTVLTGLPILSLLQFMGGVDPDLVLAGFAATGVTMVSLVSLSTLASVYARKPRDAILLTYLILAAYLGVGYLVQQVLAFPTLASLPLWFGANPLTLGDLVEGFNAGNLPIVLLNMKAAFAAGKPVAGMVSSVLRGYLIAHALIAVVCTTWAMVRVRAVALRQTRNQRRNVVLRRRPRIRPRLAIQPMVWKEVFVEPGFRPNWIGWIVVGLFMVISLLPAMWSIAQAIIPPKRISAHELVRELNGWVRIMGMVLGCLMLLGVAARASTSISGERDRDTLDALLTSPLQSHDILFAKWLGSLVSVRWGWLWLGLIWIIGLATGALHPMSVPLFSVAWLVYASFFAGVGLWFSTACRTSMRAMLWTLATTVVLGAGHLSLCFCCLPVTSFQGWTRDFFGIQLANTPPAVLYHLSASTEEIGQDISAEMHTIISYFGLFLWALGCLFLWTITRSRFRRITSRMPYRRPELHNLQVSGWGDVADEERERVRAS